MKIEYQTATVLERQTVSERFSLYLYTLSCGHQLSTTAAHSVGAVVVCQKCPIKKARKR